MHSDDDGDREFRHLAWINAGENAERLYTASQHHGRGFFFTSDGWPPENGHTPIGFFDADQLDLLPAGVPRQVVGRMLRTYKPKVQMVVVIEERGELSAYKVRALRPG